MLDGTSVSVEIIVGVGGDVGSSVKMLGAGPGLGLELKIELRLGLGLYMELKLLGLLAFPHLQEYKYNNQQIRQ